MEWYFSIIQIALKDNMVMPDEFLWAFGWFRIGLCIILNCPICIVTHQKSYSLAWCLSGGRIASERYIWCQRVLLMFRWLSGGVEVILLYLYYIIQHPDRWLHQVCNIQHLSWIQSTDSGWSKSYILPPGKLFKLSGHLILPPERLHNLSGHLISLSQPRQRVYYIWSAGYPLRQSIWHYFITLCVILPVYLTEECGTPSYHIAMQSRSSWTLRHPWHWGC
jgi:hypothetical protein